MAQRNMNAAINVGFQTAAGRELPISGESLPAIIGKLGRFCTDLKPVAFSGSCSDLSGVPDSGISGTAVGTSVRITDSADARVQGLKIFGRTENGGSVGDNGLTVNIAGKNMFNINGEININVKNATRLPENWIIDTSDQKNTVSDNVLTARLNMCKAWPDCQMISVKAGHKYTLSFRYLENEKAGVVRIDYWDSSSNRVIQFMNWWKKEFTRQAVSFTAPTDSILLGFGTTADGWSSSFTDIQLEEGETASAYEPYIGCDMSVTTGLPLRGTVGTVDLGALDWRYQPDVPKPGGTFARFCCTSVLPDLYIPVSKGVQTNDYVGASASVSSRYTINGASAGGDMPEPIDRTVAISKAGVIYIVDSDYTDAAAFKAAVSGITLTYPSYCDELDARAGTVTKRVDTDGTVLSAPVITPLSAAELAAYRQLRTHVGTSAVCVTDDPFVALGYLRNTDNGRALAAVQDDIQRQIDALSV